MTLASCMELKCIARRRKHMSCNWGSKRGDALPPNHHTSILMRILHVIGRMTEQIQTEQEAVMLTPCPKAPTSICSSCTLGTSWRRGSEERRRTFARLLVTPREGGGRKRTTKRKEEDMKKGGAIGGETSTGMRPTARRETVHPEGSSGEHVGKPGPTAQPRTRRRPTTSPAQPAPAAHSPTRPPSRPRAAASRELRRRGRPPRLRGGRPTPRRPPPPPGTRRRCGR